MRRWLILAAVVAQIATLGYMALEREWVVRTGEPVLVRTAPIDPNDPMRGDYARLSYEISAVPRALCRDGVAAWFGDGLIYSREFRDRRVYALLERDESGVVSIVALTDRRPESGLFLKGRTDWIDGSFAHVRYGIEAIFMEQGRALEFEQKARDEMVGVPVNAEVAVSPGGLGVLRGYHWEPLGITVRILRRAPEDNAEDAATRRRQSGVIGAVMTLKNHGDHPVAIVDLPHGASFRLITAEGRSDASYLPVHSSDSVADPRAEQILVLQPGESHETSLDLTTPAWFVQKPASTDQPGSEPVALESLNETWGAWFRIEYVPPSREACSGLANAELVRHAKLRSRMFNPSGGMD